MSVQSQLTPGLLLMPCRLPQRMEQEESQKRLCVPQSRQQHTSLRRDMELG